MTEPRTIALDAMGGDHGPKVVVGGATLSLERHPELSFIFFGRIFQVQRAVTAYLNPLKRMVQAELYLTFVPVVGDLMQPTDLYPTRYRVSAFPSDNQLAAIGARQRL